jgi:hypothetical protein
LQDCVGISGALALLNIALRHNRFPLHLRSAQQSARRTAQINQCDLVLGQGQDFGALGVGKIRLRIKDIRRCPQPKFELPFLRFKQPVCQNRVLPLAI